MTTIILRDRYYIGPCCTALKHNCCKKT